MASTRRRLRVLVACEHYGTVREAFGARGAFAVSADILPSDRPTTKHTRHHQGDVLSILSHDWDLLIAHPPCTYLTNSQGWRVLRDPARWKQMEEGAAFFNEFIRAPVPHICVENPIPSGQARALMDKPYTQIIQPWMFGHLESKATCLWLQNLPKLVPVTDLREELAALPKAVAQRMHYLPPSKDRWKLRSKTYDGIADAMADQWMRALVGRPSSR